ncbi:hypothetical protein D9611_000592 [Ephemerocybe angulata]|uniref:Uncharacterized protein n=1 Tax=Ephemerocybe angulata TaxID=980116 RepID=A0A8H5F721_9AGAR|nr:hypothetical protein D9611_000592 [Tulosesus angulatus]
MPAEEICITNPPPASGRPGQAMIHTNSYRNTKVSQPVGPGSNVISDGTPNAASDAVIRQRITSSGDLKVQRSSAHYLFTQNVRTPEDAKYFYTYYLMRYDVNK